MKKTPPACRQCGKKFSPRRFWQRFCSAKCRRKQYAEDLKRDLVLVRALREERDEGDVIPILPSPAPEPDMTTHEAIVRLRKAGFKVRPASKSGHHLVDGKVITTALMLKAAASVVERQRP
jgi:hypothetical protein